MLGIAQKLYIEKCNKNPWIGTVPVSPKWPLLEKMLAGNYLAYVDFALAQRLLEAFVDSNEACAALICHLSMAARQGHLCVTITHDQIIPPAEEVWLSDDSVKIEDELLFAHLRNLIVDGIKGLTPALINDMDGINASLRLPICRQSNRYYLQRSWILETNFIDHLKLLLEKTALNIEIDLSKVHHLVSEMEQKQQLLPEQASAVIQGCQSPFTVISGGPGTGKTYTAGMLLRTLWHVMSKEQRTNCRFALAAPTGKAAAQLEGSIRSAMQEVNDFPALTAQTLHALLGQGRRQSKQKSSMVISADLVLIDESSMIDARMMGHLLSALKPGARLILLGDRHQLPPVETGSLFADLVVHLQTSQAYNKHISELKTCVRAELQGIITLAEKIKQGDAAGVFDLFEKKGQEGIRNVCWDETMNIKEVQCHLLTYGISHFPIVNEIPKDPLTLLKQFLCFRILTPLRQGPLGVEALNALFYHEMLIRSLRSECIVVPIMITANHYRLGLFNGEIGLLVKFPNNSSRDVAFFASRQNGKDIRRMAALLLPKFEYAYCVSVHKSQGSEFDHVVMLLPEGSECFGREALYTGVTRARRCIELWGSSVTLREMMRRQPMRHSGIGPRLVLKG